MCVCVYMCAYLCILYVFAGGHLSPATCTRGRRYVAVYMYVFIETEMGGWRVGWSTPAQVRCLPTPTTRFTNDAINPPYSLVGGRVVVRRDPLRAPLRLPPLRRREHPQPLQEDQIRHVHAPQVRNIHMYI